MLKKTILAAVAGSALLASAAALADRDHYRAKHYKAKHHYVEHRRVVHHYHRPVVVHREVVVHRHAPVYYQPAPVYYQPAPVYYQPIDPNAGLVIAGALIGGAVAWHIVNGH